MLTHVLQIGLWSLLSYAHEWRDFICLLIREVKVTAPFDLTIASIERAKGDRTDEGTLLFRVTER